MHTARLTTATATAAVVILGGSAIAVAAGDPTPTPPPRIAFVARGDGTNFADALTVGSIAGQLGAPVFTTSPDLLPESTQTALADHDPELVIITGGTAAISPDVETMIGQVVDLPPSKVVRVAGADRFATAAEIAAIFDDLGIDAAYLPVGAKATDADLFDGKDSTAFLPTNGTAVDAHLLDGKDSTAFLGANAKAADADLLDGKDSTAFQPKGNYVTPADLGEWAQGHGIDFFFDLGPNEQASFGLPGPLTARAACTGGGTPTANVLVRSSVGPWFHSGQEFAADGESFVFYSEIPYEDQAAGIAVPESGVYLTAEATLLVGLDDHGGALCTIMGTFRPRS